MKGYWIILGTAISDPEAHDEYNRLWKPIGKKYHARINPTKAPVLKETRDNDRVIVVEFPSYDLALQCYDDPAYRAAREFGLKASSRSLLIVNGALA